jgi:hypothetical protein
MATFFPRLFHLTFYNEYKFNRQYTHMSNTFQKNGQTIITRDAFSVGLCLETLVVGGMDKGTPST